MDLENEGISNFLKQFTPLIHKSVQGLNIRPYHMDYDDYYQELQIKLLEILKNFKNDTSDPEEKKCKFVAYASQGLYWHGVDLLRKKNNHSLGTMESETMQWLVDQELSDCDSLESDLSTDEFFRLAKKRLSTEDFSLLLELAEGKHTMDELAKKHGVVRATIYQRKERIQTRLADIKDCLMDWTDN